MRSSSAVLLLISFFFVKFARSQSNELLVQGQTGKLYLEHTVVAKENWYSVGRLYNVSPKELTAFNHLTLGNPLTIGQKLEIPLTAVNFSQNGQKLATETLVPVYHVIQEKEWMYRISVNHNKVPIPSLEKWNNVNKDQIRPGMHLIVGYLKVKTGLSALASGGGSAPLASVVNAPVVKKEEVKKEEVKKEEAKKEEAAPPVEVKEVKMVDSSPAEKPVVKQTEKLKVENGGNVGAFKGDYSESNKSVSGQAGTFKSTSGWQDGKYYALMNNVPVGTIVRINDGATGKSVYAKVLGGLPDMKESAGLTIRISNAAAAELGEGEGRFLVEVKY